MTSTSAQKNLWQWYKEFSRDLNPVKAFIAGVLVTVGTLWSIYTYIFLPELQRRNDRAYEAQVEEGRRLRDEVGGLELSIARLQDSMQAEVELYVDSLAKQRTFGQSFGVYELPTKVLNINYPLIGNEIRAKSIWAESQMGSISLEIDTCPAADNLMIADSLKCYPVYHYELPLSLHNHSPIHLGRFEYSILLREVRDSSATIEVFRRWIT